MQYYWAVSLSILKFGLDVDGSRGDNDNDYACKEEDDYDENDDDDDDDNDDDNEDTVLFYLLL